MALRDAAEALAEGQRAASRELTSIRFAFGEHLRDPLLTEQALPFTRREISRIG